MPDDFVSTATPAPASAGERDPLWPWLLALAAPFVLCLSVLLVTGRTLPVFWGDDEILYWQLAQRIAAYLPRFEPNYTGSAPTPLLHFLGGCLVRLLGPHLQLARTMNVAFSLAGVFALFALLRRVMRHGPATAALLASVYGLSCYFFGYSFRFLTDDLALTCCICALSFLFRFAEPAEPRRLRTFLFGCLWLGLTILTRQNYVFLGLPFGVVLLLSGLPARDLAAGVGGMALAVAPYAGLVCAWHGLVPPEWQVRHTSSPVNLYPVALPLMLLGFYTPFFVGPDLVRRWRAIPARQFLWPAVAAVMGLIILWKYALAPIPGRPDLLTYFPGIVRQAIGGYFAGWLYNAAFHLPKLHGNSLLFWALLPTGLAAAAGFLREATRPDTAPHRRVAVLFLLGLVLSSVFNSVSVQKYYDAPVLLFLIWHTRGEVTRDFWRRTALGGLIFLFAAYFAIYVATAKPSSAAMDAAPPPPAPVSATP